MLAVALVALVEALVADVAALVSLVSAAVSDAAAAVRTNKPAPIIAPIPKAIKLPAPRVRFIWLFSACANKSTSDFFLQMLINNFLGR